MQGCGGNERENKHTSRNLRNVKKGAKGRNTSFQIHVHLLCCFLLAVTSKALWSEEYNHLGNENTASHQSSHYEHLFLESYVV